MRLLLLGLFGLVALIFAIYLLYKNWDQSSNLNLNKVVELIDHSKLVVPKSWVIYRNDVVGVEFRYPPSWGEPMLNPTENITNLETVNEGRSANNAYDDSISISFPNDGPGLELFDKTHKGEFDYDSNRYSQEYVDGFSEVMRAGQVCSYKFSFPTQPFWDETYKEVYNNCSSGIKTSITESVRTFTFGDENKTGVDFTNSLREENIYDYEILLSYYKNLQNGVFDDLIVTQLMAGINSDRKQLLNYDEYLKAGKLTESKLERERTNFRIFINSIKSFKPKPIIPPVIKNTTSDPNIATIFNYYERLNNKELKRAYDMYLVKPANYPTFSSWYENIFYARPYDFHKIANGKYEFFVEYRDHNKPKQKYRVVMKVEGDKIEIISSERFVGNSVDSGNLKAFVKQMSGKNYVVLVKDGKESIIEEALAEPGNVRSKGYEVLEFSPDNKYLIYRSNGWEWFSLIVYDILAERVVKEFDATAFQMFSPDSKYFVACASDHFGSARYGEIYSTNNGLVNIFDLSKQVDTEKAFDIGCEYDKPTNSIIFGLYNDQGKVLEKYQYNFEGQIFKPIFPR